jgi:hypothetical protein
MKKYFLGLTAIVLAIAFSSFTKPKTVTSQLFAYDAATYGTTEAAIQNPAHWVAVSSQSCTADVNADADRACKILVSDDRYFTFDSDEGANVLNTSGTFTMAIATQKTLTSPEVAKVILSGTTGVAQQADITSKSIDVLP